MSVAIIIVVVFALVIGLIYAVYRYQKKRDAAAAGWPGTEGRIVSSSVKADRQQDTENNTESVTYTPRVVYAYAVDGVEYKSHRISFFSGATTQRKATEICARYGVESIVAVYYNPEKPGDSVLERGKDALK